MRKGLKRICFRRRGVDTFSDLYMPKDYEFEHNGKKYSYKNDYNEDIYFGKCMDTCI